jgi:ankyrin repeat protein
VQFPVAASTITSTQSSNLVIELQRQPGNDAARIDSLIELHPQLAVQVDGRSEQPIHHAARNGATEIVRSLIAAGASVDATNTRKHTVLYCAAGHARIRTASRRSRRSQ